MTGQLLALYPRKRAPGDQEAVSTFWRREKSLASRRNLIPVSPSFSRYMRIKRRHEHVTVFYFGGNQEHVHSLLRFGHYRMFTVSVNPVQNSNIKTVCCLLTAHIPLKNNNTYNFQTHNVKVKPENNEMRSRKRFPYQDDNQTSLFPTPPTCRNKTINVRIM